MLISLLLGSFLDFMDLREKRFTKLNAEDFDFLDESRCKLYKYSESSLWYADWIDSPFPCRDPINDDLLEFNE